jgi:hypothetical protein
VENADDDPSSNNDGDDDNGREADDNGDEEMFEEVGPDDRDQFMANNGAGRNVAVRNDGDEEPGEDEERNNQDQVAEYEDEMQVANYEGYDPDEDDDFPEFANEENKKMNENIKAQKRTNKQIQLKIEELRERLAGLKQHQKYILVELKNTQDKIEMKNEETNTEKHLSQLAERQIGKITADLRKYDQTGVELQDRLNDIQQQIFKGNDQLEKLKLEINWNKEEKQQWIVAVKQKEEDNIALVKYKRKDDNKIKDLSLQLEKLTVNKNKMEEALEKEITETQALQIEIDKTAEEFKKQHAERHRIYAQWDEAIQNIAYRHESTLKITTDNVTIQMEMKNNLEILNEKKKQLEREKQSNKKDEEKIASIEKEILRLKNLNEKFRKDEATLNAKVKINQNTLSADSSRLSEMKNMMEMLEKELQGRKQRLTNADKKYKAQVEILKSEDNIEKLAMGSLM